MMIHTHQTAPTQFVEASGIRFAYRRFGKPDGVPLVFKHFTGTMDHWDPAVTQSRESSMDDDKVAVGHDNARLILDRWPRDGARGYSVQQRRRLEQLRRGSDVFSANGGQRSLFYQGAGTAEGRCA